MPLRYWCVYTNIFLFLSQQKHPTRSKQCIGPRIHWKHLVEACGLSLRLGEALNLWIELKRSRSQRGFLGHPSMARVFLPHGSVCPFRIFLVEAVVSGITSAFQQASHGGNLLAIIQFEAYQYNSQPPSSERLSNRPVKGGAPPKKGGQRRVF